MFSKKRDEYSYLEQEMPGEAKEMKFETFDQVKESERYKLQLELF